MSSEPDSGGTAEQGPIMPLPLMRLMARVNVLVYRLSGGRLMNELGGGPICLVTMTGARSGKRRTIPLMYVPNGDDVLLVASQGGAPGHPVWYYNLVAHPDVVLEQGGQRRSMTARLLAGEERDAAWPVCDRFYPPYAEYRTRTERQIPVFVCEPSLPG